MIKLYCWSQSTYHAVWPSGFLNHRSQVWSIGWMINLTSEFSSVQISVEVFQHFYNSQYLWSAQSSAEIAYYSPFPTLILWKYAFNPISDCISIQYELILGKDSSVSMQNTICSPATWRTQLLHCPMRTVPLLSHVSFLLCWYYLWNGDSRHIIPENIRCHVSSLAYASLICPFFPWIGRHSLFWDGMAKILYFLFEELQKEVL